MLLRVPRASWACDRSWVAVEFFSQRFPEQTVLRARPVPRAAASCSCRRLRRLPFGLPSSRTFGGLLPFLPLAFHRLRARVDFLAGPAVRSWALFTLPERDLLLLLRSGVSRLTDSNTGVGVVVAVAGGLQSASRGGLPSGCSGSVPSGSPSSSPSSSVGTFLLSASSLTGSRAAGSTSPSPSFLL